MVFTVFVLFSFGLYRYSSETCHRFLSSALLLLTFWFFISSAVEPFTQPLAKIISCCSFFLAHSLNERQKTSCAECESLSAFYSPIFITIIYMFDTYAQITRKVSQHFMWHRILFTSICQCSLVFLFSFSITFLAIRPGILFAELCYLFWGLIIIVQTEKHKDASNFRRHRK